MNNDTNPMFSKFDQVLGKTTPTSFNAPTQSRADEIRSIAQTAQNAKDNPDVTSYKADQSSAGNFSNAPKEVAEEYLNTLGKTYADTPSKISNDIQAGAEDMQKGNLFKGILKSGLRTSADIANAVYAPISTAVGMVFNKLGVTDAIAHSDLVDKLSNQKWLQDFAMSHPNAEEDFNRALTLAMSTGEKGTIDPNRIINDVKTSLEKMKNPPEPPIEKPPTTIPDATPQDRIIKENGQVDPNKAQELAWKDIQPKSTAGTKLAYAKAGNATEQGLFKGGEITPSPADQRLIDTHAQLYEDGTINDSMSPNEKQTAINQKAKQLNIDQNNFLRENDKAVNLSATDVKGKPIGLFDKLDSASKESTLPFARDTTLKAAYDSIIDTFKSKLETGKSAGSTKESTTLSKISEALTSFDQAMEKFGAYKKSKTGELTDSAQIRQNAIRDVHTTVRDFISEELPKNSPWKNIRDQESRMYEISDRLAQRIAEGVGTGKILKAVKDNPIIKSAIEASGLGTALKILH